VDIPQAKMRVLAQPLLPSTTLWRGKPAMVLPEDHFPLSARAEPHSIFLLADDGPNPLSDIYREPAAVACLVVLAIMGGFLGFVAYQDQSAKRRRQEDAAQLASIAEEMRERGREEEARAIELEAMKTRAQAKRSASAVKPAEAQTNPFGPMGSIGGLAMGSLPGKVPIPAETETNRFERRITDRPTGEVGAEGGRKSRRRRSARRGMGEARAQERRAASKSQGMGS